MALKRGDEQATGDKKKKKRVAFNAIDSGVEANDCINIFLVKCKEEVGDSQCSSVDPVDLNQFFGEDGKIYGYKGLKIDVWLSVISFHAYADITFEVIVDGGKGITDLEPCLKKLFGESLVEKKEFLQSFSSERPYIGNVISNGKVVLHKAVEEGDEASAIEVIQMSLKDLTVGTLYCRLVPLVLLFIEGGQPVDLTDSGWDIYFVVNKISGQREDPVIDLLGFATVYRFYRYPDSTRLRISQILVLPPYQNEGHGRFLLEGINSIATEENIFDVTAEEPSDYLQSLRLCMDSLRLLGFDLVMSAVNTAASHLREVNPLNKPCKAQVGPPAHVAEKARERLKISKKQLLRCWEVLLHMKLEPEDSKSCERFRRWVSERVREEILGRDFNEREKKTKKLVEVPNDHNPEMSFVVFVSPDGSEESSVKGLEPEQEQIEKVVDEEMEEIAEIARKVSSLQEARGSSTL